MKNFFEKRFNKSRFLDVRAEFAEKVTPIEIRTDHFTGIVSRILAFRGLFIEHNAEIGQKDHLWMDTCERWWRDYE